MTPQIDAFFEEEMIGADITKVQAVFKDVFNEPTMPADARRPN